MCFMTVTISDAIMTKAVTYLLISVSTDMLVVIVMRRAEGLITLITEDVVSNAKFLTLSSLTSGIRYFDHAVGDG